MRVFLVVVLVGVSGCSLLTSLDELHGDASVDATSDAFIADVTTNDVADADAATTDASGFCASHPSVVFCDDFDQVDAAAFAKWSSVFQTNGGSVSLIDSDASAPHAAHFHNPSFDGGGFSPQSALDHIFVTAPTKSMTLQFDLLVEKYPSNSDSISLSPLRPDPASTGQLYFAMNSIGAAYAELVDFSDGGSFYNNWPLSVRPLVGEWTHIEIDWTLGTTNTVTVYVGGTIAMAPTQIDGLITFAIPTLTMGLTYEDPGTDLAIVDVDNVLFDYQ